MRPPHQDKGRSSDDSSVQMENPKARTGPAFLRLVAPVEPEGTLSSIELDVRSVRRGMARLLRAMQIYGDCVSSWSNSLVSALAHADAVTARHLINGEGDVDDVQRAIASLSTLEALIVGNMSESMRVSVHKLTLGIRIRDEDLLLPLVQAPAAMSSFAVTSMSPSSETSLRAGLSTLTLTELEQVGRRMGALATYESIESVQMQAVLIDTAATLLVDHQLLSILVATLDKPEQRLLVDLVYGRYEAHELKAMAERGCPTSDPLHSLRLCGLVFCTVTDEGATTWVPTDLQHVLEPIVGEFGL